MLVFYGKTVYNRWNETVNWRTGMKVLVIIPAYNEEENIKQVVDNLKATCPFVDYVIINDCSKDRTVQICEENHYNYISLPGNLGIGGGVQTGYLYARDNGYDIAIQYDGDGQHNAEYIKDLIKPLEEGIVDMTIGSRFINKEGFQTSAMRRTGITILKWVIRICSGVTATDATSGFRAANRRLIEFFADNYAQDYPEPEAIVAARRSGYRIMDVPVVMNERTAGVSSIGAMDSVYYMIKVVLAIFACRLVYRKRKEG